MKCKVYELSDPNDLTILNNMFNDIGLHFEANLFEPYVWVDHDRYRIAGIRNTERKKKAIRKTPGTSHIPYDRTL
jgi:hypothetical protein